MLFAKLYHVAAATAKKKREHRMFEDAVVD